MFLSVCFYDGLLFQFALCKISEQCYYWLKKYHHLLLRRYAAQFEGQTIPSQRATLCLKRIFYNQLNELAEENQVSTFHVILGALYCYFVRTCHREDLNIGLFTLNRNSAAFKKMVGMVVKSI